MIPQHDAQQIRRQLEGELGFDIADATWDYLVEKALAEEVWLGNESISWLAEEARKLLEAGGQPAGRGRRGPRTVSSAETGHVATVGPLRQLVLSQLIAKQAESDRDVQAFREEVLGGHLLSADEVEQWIQQQEADGEPTTWIGVPLPSGHKLIYDPDSPEVLGIEPPVTVSEEQALAEYARWHRLTYGVPDDERERYAFTTAGGVLERLRLLSEQLARDYGWTPSQAVCFVLTGEVPQIAPVRAAAHVSYPLATVTRVTLTIDPALSPREVANRYRHFRREVVGQRHRNLSEKHLRLAQFAALGPQDQTWASKMTEWNRNCANPRWRYTSERNFARDCKVAQERLLRPNYQIPTWVDEDYVEEV